MFKIWCIDKNIGCLTNITLFHSTKDECIKEFQKYYGNKYELVNIIKYK